MKEDKNGVYYSKSDILKEMKDWIKKYNLGNYLTLGDDEVLHINENFKEKMDKLIQDNPKGFSKYIIKILGYDNIVKGVAETLFKKMSPALEEALHTANENNYEQELNFYIKEYIKNGTPDKYVKDYEHLYSAVEDYYKSKAPEIRKSLETSDIADIFKVINNLDSFNWHMDQLELDVYEYRDNYEMTLSDRANASYIYDKVKREEKYNKLKSESKKLPRIEENLKFVRKLYSETYELSKKCAKTFLHDRGDKLSYVEDSYFDRWELKDEMGSLSYSNKLENDVTNYLIKNYNSMIFEFDKKLEEEHEEKTR